MKTQYPIDVPETETIEIHMTTALHAAIVEHAERRGVAPAEWTRDAIVNTVTPEDFDALLAHIEQLASGLSQIPPVNDRFVSPVQIARVLRELYGEPWEYRGAEDGKDGAQYVGGHGEIHQLECGDELRPLYCDSQGTWHMAFRDRVHYGECDWASTMFLLAYAQEHKL